MANDNHLNKKNQCFSRRELKIGHNIHQAYEDWKRSFQIFDIIRYAFGNVAVHQFVGIKIKVKPTALTKFKKEDELEK